MDHYSKKAGFSWYWGLTLVESVLAGVWLFSLPSDEKNAVIGRFSFPRLAMIGLISFIALTALFFLTKSFDIKTNFYKRCKVCISQKKRRIAAKLASASFFILAGLLYYFSYIEPLKYLAYFQRLRPLAVFGVVWSLQTSLFLTGIKKTSLPQLKSRFKKMLPVFLLALSFHILLYFLIRKTGLGITPDPFDWQPNGISLQWWQLFGAVLTALIGSALSSLLPGKLQEDRLRTGLLFLLIWAGAALLWTSVPSADVLKNSYFMEITAPNEVPYPASDAAYFGLWSESILAGLGLKDQVISRQLFVLFLAAVQRISGSDIWLAIDLLTITLALIPALLFLIGKQLHSTSAGLMTALVAMTREISTLYLAPLFGVSNSKMFLSDLPMLLAFLIFISVFISWQKQPQNFRRLIFSGILLGMSILIRSQALVLLPAVWLFILLQRSGAINKPRSVLWFTAALLLVILPALTRSLTLTGSPMLEDSGIHSGELVRRYADDPNWQPQIEPDESAEAFSSRMNRSLVQSFFDHPLFILNFSANHFTKDLIDAWLVLPAGIPPEFTILERTDPAYQDAGKRLLYTSWLQLLFFAGMIAVGAAAMWRKNRSASLIPPVFCALYMLSAAIGRYSGWRFILPADWFFYLIFSAGTFEIISWIRCLFSNSETEQSGAQSFALQLPQPVWLTAAILLIAFSWLPVFSAAIIPDRIRLEPSAAKLQCWLENDSCSGACSELTSQVVNGEKEIINGLVIYPRWFEAGDGLTSANPWAVNEVRPFNRLSFVMLNEQNWDVILPLESSPGVIPQREACLVIGEMTDAGWFQADALNCPDESLIVLAADD